MRAFPQITGIAGILFDAVDLEPGVGRDEVLMSGLSREIGATHAGSSAWAAFSPANRPQLLRFKVAPEAPTHPLHGWNRLPHTQQSSDPVIQKATALLGDVVVHRKDELFQSREEWTRNEIIRSLPNLPRVRDFAGGFVRGSDQTMWGVVLYRMDKDPMFRRSDLRRLTLFLALMRKRHEAAVESVQELDPVKRFPEGHQAVFRELFGGATEKEIAETSGYKPSTIHSYVRDICSWLDVGGRGKLVAKFGAAYRSQRRAAL